MTAQELVTNSNCLDHCIADGQKLGVIIYLLATLAGVATDAQTLINNANCVDHCIPDGMKPGVIVSLLDTFVSGGAGGFVTCGSGAPTVAPAAGCGLYIDTATDAVYIYRNGAWVLKV